MAPVRSISYEVIGSTRDQLLCTDRLLSTRQKAMEDEAVATANQSWIRKNWQPLLGATLGTAIGFSLTKNYASGNKWVAPTAIGGTALGYFLGPGAMIGGYAAGAAGFGTWSTKIPLASGVTLAGAILGYMAWDWVFAKSPLLIPPKEGEYLATQEFITENQCYNQTVSDSTTSSYRVEYEHGGKLQTAFLEYFPGNYLRVDEEGKALDRLQASDSTATN